MAMLSRCLVGAVRRSSRTAAGQPSAAAAAPDLRTALAVKIPGFQEEVKAFRKDYGSAKVGQITVDSLYGGQRMSLVTETSVLDPEEGIRFRGFTIPQCQALLPKAAGGSEPLPEGLFWLLVTGDIPTVDQVAGLSRDLAGRAELPAHVITLLNNLPASVPPMTQFAAAIAALNSESKFARAYEAGVARSRYWEETFEDSMDLVARLPVVAATIYNNMYREGAAPCAPDPAKDWSWNFTEMLGYREPLFTELMRQYLAIHSDHEGGNVSAHATHLVGSALCDPYLALCAGMCGLSGPLHGAAVQEVLVFLDGMVKEVGEEVEDEVAEAYIWRLLKSGRTVPGYGHAVLRLTDPRFTCQREFAEQHLQGDPMIRLVAQLQRVVPPVLLAAGHFKNPWPNVDAHSGVVLRHFGLHEQAFYTVLFGVSRALGVTASLVWDRALGHAMERPKSLSTAELKKLVGAV